MGVAAIALVVFLETVIIQYYYPPEQLTPFLSPACTGIACGIMLKPGLNTDLLYPYSEVVWRND